MREIDESDNNSEPRLSQALRSLSATSTREAPPEIGDALSNAFRRHHARRKARQWTAIASAILTVALAAAVPMLKRNPAKTTIAETPATVTVSPAATTQASEVASASEGQTTIKVRHASRKQPAIVARSEFVALPVSEPIGEEALRIIRLELSGNTLRLFGAPVNEETAARRVLADFVVGEDGTPYAVRLVR